MQEQQLEHVARCGAPLEMAGLGFSLGVFEIEADAAPSTRGLLLESLANGDWGQERGQERGQEHGGGSP
jgi:hypothetical protein